MIPSPMDTAQYRVVFDVSRTSLEDAHSMAVVAGVSALAMLVAWLRPQLLAGICGLLDKRWFQTVPELRALAIVLGAAGLTVSALTLRTEFSIRQDLRSALAQHRYTVVEGPVTQFVRGDSVRRIPESFAVAGHRYEFYKWQQKFGFSGNPGGQDVIAEGMPVRIADVNGVIARLEVAGNDSVGERTPLTSRGAVNSP